MYDYGFILQWLQKITALQGWTLKLLKEIFSMLRLILLTTRLGGNAFFDIVNVTCNMEHLTKFLLIMRLVIIFYFFWQTPVMCYFYNMLCPAIRDGLGMDGQEGLLKRNSWEQLIQKKNWKMWMKNVNFFFCSNLCGLNFELVPVWCEGG